MLDMINNIWLFAGGIAAGVTTLLHIFVGGSWAVASLMKSNDISNVSKYTNYYCWHLVTITLAAMSAGLVWAAVDPNQTGLAWMWTGIAVLFCLWSIVLIVWKGQNPLVLPQWMLFATIAGLSLTGLMV